MYRGTIDDWEQAFGSRARFGLGVGASEGRQPQHKAHERDNVPESARRVSKEKERPRHVHEYLSAVPSPTDHVLLEFSSSIRTACRLTAHTPGRRCRRSG